MDAREQKSSHEPGGAVRSVDAAPVLQPDRSGRGSPLSTMVLAVSDDATLFALLRNLLEAEDAAVLPVGTDSDATQLVQDIRPGLVVVDAGEHAARRIEAARNIGEFHKGVPIVVLVDKADRELAIRAVQEGAHDFVEKPLDERLLKFALVRGLEVSRLTQSEREHRRLLEETSAEKTLEIVREKDFLQGILDSSTLVSVILTDLSQRVLFWNSGAENILGFTAEEMIGSSITRIYPPDAVSTETVDKLREMVQTKIGIVYGKMEQRAKDGRSVTMSLALTPMVEKGGGVVGILGMGLDVTEEVRLHEELVKSFEQIKATQDATIFSLAKLTESRDRETGFHLVRIRNYCRSLAARLAHREGYEGIMTEGFIDDLVRSSILHDIGKVGIPDSILLSTEKFTAEEFLKMQEHPKIGGDALAEAARELGEKSFLSHARDIAYHHHERWDGGGYPFRLRGPEIPLSARIVAMADVYDALTSERRYKKAFAHEEAVKIMVEGKGKHFDPDLVEVFVEVAAEFDTIRKTYSA
ncbi:MAG: PAS domain S-box protein [Desulfomonile tiedjei]|nr:PAS domain S-box protein [Desulfomonile tiedjei]